MVANCWLIKAVTGIRQKLLHLFLAIWQAANFWLRVEGKKEEGSPIKVIAYQGHTFITFMIILIYGKF
jgi:hypothetical protein